MKKPNRIARKGDTTRTRAQSKAAPLGAESKATRDSAEVPLETALETLPNPEPAGSRSLHSPALVAALKRFLSPESFAVLAEMDDRYGASIEQQLAGALGAWIAFVERERARHAGYTVEFVTDMISEYCCVLNPDQMEFSVSRARSRLVTEHERRTYQRIVAEMKRWPIEDGSAFAGLGMMLRHHPGFAEESESLTAAGEGIEALGQSPAISR